MIEDDLKNLCLIAAAETPRDRILAAAKESRRDSRVGRWISRAALTAVAIALFAVAIGEKELAPEATLDPDRALHPRFSFPDESLQEDGPWRP